MKAVAAEARKMEKGDGGSAGPPTWLTGALGWAPRKLRELKTFFGEVRAELKKVTWPSKKEVYATTLVVIVTTVFFGFYLYGLDLVFSQVFARILGQ
jgi:preprotein translocase subunit SecE